MTWKADRRKMYAHVYFDLSQDSCGVAVYSIGKVPGFSKKLSPELQDATGKTKARDAFLKILGKGEITPEQLQLGKVFKFEDMQERLHQLDLLGKLIAGDTTADIVVDLDDPMFWFEAAIQNWPRAKQNIAHGLSDEQKIQLGNTVREQELERELKEAETAEDLADALQRLYIYVSRKVHPTAGPMDFPGSKKYPAPTPPAFLVSEELNFAYYPGFRGAQWMRKIPKEHTKEVYPMGGEDDVPTQEKWQTTIIPDCKEFTEMPLQMIDVKALDYVSEVLARMFFYNLPRGDMSAMAFNQSVEPMREKAKAMLSKIGDQYRESVTAGMEVGTWIHLGTGKTYDTEEDLLADNPDAEAELPLAASVKLRRMARTLLKRNPSLYKKVMSKYE